MKILYHHRSLADGAEGVHIDQMVRAFRELGHDVTICSLVGSRTNEPSRTASVLDTVKRALPRALFELAEVGYAAPGALWLAGRQRALDADFVYERYACANAAGVLASRLNRVPLILEINAPLVLERQEHEGGLTLSALLGAVERRVFAHADRCVVVSTPLADYVESLGVARDRIEVMPNGADPRAFDPCDRGEHVRARYCLGDGPVVGFCGVLRPWHGVDSLVEAVARHLPGDAQLLLVGDGPSAGEVRELARRLGIGERVHVTGRVPHEQMAAHLAACDIAVSPHATFYASPMKIPEYMAAGRAVVAPRMANIEDLIDDARTGLLFSPESSESLGEALARLVADPRLREALGAAARSEVESRLNWRRNAGRVVSLVEELRHSAR